MIKEYKYLYIALLIWSVLGLDRINSFPMVNSDESWDLSTPYTFLTKGSFSNPVLRTYENKMKQSEAQVRVEPKIMHSILMIPIGFLFGISVLTGRLLSFAFAFLTIIILYLLLKRHVKTEFRIHRLPSFNDRISFLDSSKGLQT